MLRFPAAMRFFNNPATSFLQSDVLAYAALDAYYLLLLFLASVVTALSPNSSYFGHEEQAHGPPYRIAQFLGLQIGLQYETDPALPQIPHEVDNLWIDRIAANQPLCDRTYQGTHYCYLPSTILSLLQVDGEWFQRLTTCMPLAALLALPCSTAEYAYVNDLLIRHAQNFDLATRTTF
uniref:Uncharacterized protein n=1 Tax=Romanomermis culicivorax TaxID=13658 RepID=A0A915J1L9_ROMCU